MCEITEYLTADESAHTGLRWIKSPKGRGKVGAVAGSAHIGGYWKVIFRKKLYLAHRVVWYLHHGVWPSGKIDHINGIRGDNRIGNLRDVSQSVNIKNKVKQSNNKTGFTGVHFDKESGKYRAQIKSQGVVRDLGRFLFIEDAIAARRVAEVEDGEFTERHGK